jgi:NAD(P)-dependent dehydrogenase (short-subunit alcohol dehydrogenase family)
MSLLEGKVALITGARGICQAVVLGLAKEGADVAFTFMPDAPGDVTPTKENVEKVKSMGRKVVSIGADIRKIDEIRKVVKKTLDEFGRIDILVNCAGVYTYTSALDTTDEIYHKDMDTNLKGTMLCCQEVARSAMIPQRKGRIVNIASITGVLPQDNLFSYSIAKAGVIHLTKYLAREWARYGIGVNAISPGFTLTEPVRIAIEKGDLDGEAIARRCPMKRLGKPEEMAEAIAWLTSDRCPYCTGANLVVDGGYTAGFTPYE